MYILDTNICIYVMKNLYPRLTEKLLSSDPRNMVISSISVYELEYGAQKSNWGERTKQKLAMFLAPFDIIPFSLDDAFYAGSIRAHLEKSGNIIGPYDIQIAAQALSRNMTLITHNVSEFARVPDLTLEDWAE